MKEVDIFVALDLIFNKIIDLDENVDKTYVYGYSDCLKDVACLLGKNQDEVGIK